MMPPKTSARAMAGTISTVYGTRAVPKAVSRPRMRTRCVSGRSTTPGPASSPTGPNGATLDARASWLMIHGESPYSTSPPHCRVADAVGRHRDGDVEHEADHTRERRDPSGRARRHMPIAPSGIMPRMSTRRSWPMAPRNSSPRDPSTPNAVGLAELEPRPDELYPLAHWWSRSNGLDGKAVNWPTAGIGPVSRSRLPMTSRTRRRPPR